MVDYQSQSSLTITGVVPRADGYGPVPSPTVYSAALARPCRGAFVAWKDDGSVRIFAGTATKLYISRQYGADLVGRFQGRHHLHVGGASRAMAVRPVRHPGHRGAGQYGPQVYDLTAGGAFADLALQSAPWAPAERQVYRYRRSLVGLSGLTQAPASILGRQSVRVQWSGLNAPTTWTSA